MTARDFSVMPVQVVGEPKPIERAVRRRGNSLNVGSICDVEFGATWRYVGSVAKERVDGQWFACTILRHEGAIVHVELLPDVRLNTPPIGRPISCGLCDDYGNVCEDHPMSPFGHGCGGAGKPCENRQCEWWQLRNPH